MNNHNRWRIGALASAIALLGSLASLEAHALALGRITVQSALGEPLRAEIDMADINAEEVASLRVGIASAEAFKAAGLEYSAAVTGLEVRLQRRTDGRPYLRLSSSRAITEPFVDLILETNGSAGRMTRDYTMLFDPPKLRGASPIEPAAAVLSRAPLANAVGAASLPFKEAMPTPSSPALPPAVRPAPLARASAIKSTPVASAAAGSRQVVVRPGDTASKIAARDKPSTVSLDQMLAAMLRSNPDAFIGGNINIIKSGAVLDMPGEESGGTLPGEARSVIAQSQDFNAFRRKLAEGAPTAQASNAERQAGGKVQTTVEDRAAQPAAPDKLKLSGGAVQGRAATPAVSPAAPSGAALPPLPPPAAVPDASAAVSVSGGTTASAAALQTSAAGTGVVAPLASASEPALAASAATIAAPPPVKKPAVAEVIAPPQASLWTEALDNPLLLWVSGGLLALLGGLLFVRYRKNKKMGHVDSSFLESRVQLDSFFGASGGQRIDTRASSIGTATSTAYTPSQLDHAGDVDPVAEADVYLAYGRDQQAEEILKEALRSHPARVAVHAKLVEIYAKRRDSKAFDSIALEAFRVTQGNGPEWAHITKLGRDINPGNSMYRPRPEPASSFSEKGLSVNSAAGAAKSLLATAGLTPAGAQETDANFSLNDTQLSQFSTSTLGTPSAFLEELDLDLDLDIESAPAPLMADSSRAPLSVSPPEKVSSQEVDFLSGGLDFQPDAFMAPNASPTLPDPGLDATHSGMLEFDLSSLSLDLGPATRAPSLAAVDAIDDPLEIKFLLAEEFRILGDSAGARSLADEVLAKARGPLKVKAQAFLNTLS